MFLRISVDMLNEGSQYSVPIFLYNPNADERTAALEQFTEVSEENLSDWKRFIEKDAYLQIDEEDLETFLEEANTSLEFIKQENRDRYTMMAIYEQREKLYKLEVASPFRFKAALQVAVESDDFSSMISRARAEICLIPVTISKEVSTIVDIIDKLFVEDNFTNRLTAFVYFFCKLSKIDDDETICDILLATLCMDLGRTQINLDLLKDFEKERLSDLYEKHPMLSIYVMSKSGLDLSKNVKRYILEHHELYDGSGFPRGKKEDYVHMNSQIIHMSYMLFSYSQGYITGNKVDFFKVMGCIANETPLQYLQTSFHYALRDSLRSLIPIDLREDL